MRNILQHCCLLLGLLSLALATPAVAQTAQPQASPAETWEICRRHIADAERRFTLPAHLLYAIARAESGRWDAASKANLAWPWTVMAEGRGRFLPSKAAAIAEVETLRARGIRNIDVGCMQVNLHHHAKAFPDLEAAFDPARNAAYAASFLKDLRREARSWTRAIGHYHSRTPRLGNGYRRKVQRLWRDERHRANDRRRQARVLGTASPSAVSPGVSSVNIPAEAVPAQSGTTAILIGEFRLTAQD